MSLLPYISSFHHLVRSFWWMYIIWWVHIIMFSQTESFHLHSVDLVFLWRFWYTRWFTLNLVQFAFLMLLMHVLDQFCVHIWLSALIFHNPVTVFHFKLGTKHGLTALWSTLTWTRWLKLTWITENFWAWTHNYWSSSLHLSQLTWVNFNCCSIWLLHFDSYYDFALATIFTVASSWY